MKNKLILLSGVLLIIIIGTFFVQSPFYSTRVPSNSSSSSNETSTTEINEEVSVTIDYGNGETISETYTFEKGLTPFSLLEKVTLDNQVSVETESYDFGVFVKSINDLESTTEMSWIYFVNGESGQVAADQYELAPEDIVYWSYIPPSENDI